MPVILFCTLMIMWLILSGYFTGLLLTFGVLSCLFVVYIAQRMRLYAKDKLSVKLLLQLPSYGIWLVWQIILSNIAVAKTILRNEPIKPVMAELPALQKTILGQVIYANSITLTPGTVSIVLKNNVILVHALYQSGIDDLVAGEMSRRVLQVDQYIIGRARSSD